MVGSVAGQGGAQIAGNALAPYAAQVIGNAFDHTDNPNQAAQILSHAILGATLAYVNGGNVATGAAVGAGSELAAQYLTQKLYGDDQDARNPDGSFNANLLSEDKKQNIVGITSAIGALVGGGGLYNAAVGVAIANNAVVNNEVSPYPASTYLERLEVDRLAKQPNYDDPRVNAAAKLLMEKFGWSESKARTAAASYALGVDAISGYSYAKGIDSVSNKVSTTKITAKERAELKARLIEENFGRDDGDLYGAYRSADGNWKHPNNLGFSGEATSAVLPIGTKLDRFGSSTGSFLSPAGASYGERALPPSSMANGYSQYIVIKPLPVTQGKTAPAFGQTGGGTQILPNLPTRMNVNQLLNNGYIRRVR